MAGGERQLEGFFLSLFSFFFLFLSFTHFVAPANNSSVWSATYWNDSLLPSIRSKPRYLYGFDLEGRKTKEGREIRKKYSIYQ